MSFALSTEHRRAPPGALPLKRWRARTAARVRLVCLPWCGAGASVYRHLALLLPDTIDLLAVQLPGREERYREPLLRRMDAAVEHVSSALLARQDLPLVLFGHSMGAMVAHELAHALRSRTGREPDLLIVSGHAAPGSLRESEEHWHASSDEQMCDNLRRVGGTPESVLCDDTLMRALMPALRADYEILETHAMPLRTPLSCPLVACTGLADPTTPLAGMVGWRQFTHGASEVHRFEGDHFYFRNRPELLASRLLGWIDRHLEPNGLGSGA